jgi:hypothetical protein
MSSYWTCLLFLVVLVAAAVGVTLGFVIANYRALHPVTSSATSSAWGRGGGSGVPFSAMANAATSLVRGAQPSACAGVPKCPPGDIECELCRCYVATTVIEGSPDPCTVSNCVCSALINDEATRTCASGAPPDKCTICQLIPPGQCAASPE